MNITEKLKAEIKPGYISLQPNQRAVSSLLWEMSGIALAGIILFIFKEKLDQSSRFFFLAVISFLVIRLALEIAFIKNVHYIFDERSNSIYRENLPYKKRKLMAMDQAVIFTSSVSGEWHYSLGIKKKQFQKNYRISPSFGSGNVSQKRAQEYENKILMPIMDLLAKKT